MRHAALEIDKVVNMKTFAKGNALIYELDHTTRQMRIVKDNVYSLEDRLKGKIRIEFDKDLQRARQELEELRRKFGEYQNTLNDHMKAEVQKNKNDLDSDLKKIVLNGYKPPHYPSKEKSKGELVDDYSHLFKG